MCNSNLEIALKLVERDGVASCGICGAEKGPCYGPELFLTQTGAAVCEACGQSKAKELSDCLKSLNLRNQRVAEAYKKIKASKLRHYGEREPMLFNQIDAFLDGFDNIVQPGPDGVAVIGGQTWELMTGCYEVRLLIRHDVKIDAAARAVKSIIDAMRDSFCDGENPQTINDAALQESDRLGNCRGGCDDWPPF